MNYAKIEFLSTPGVIFSPASGGFATDHHRGSTPGPDLPLLFKLHDIWFSGGSTGGKGGDRPP